MMASPPGDTRACSAHRLEEKDFLQRNHAYVWPIEAEIQCIARRGALSDLARTAASAAATSPCAAATAALLHAQQGRAQAVPRNRLQQIVDSALLEGLYGVFGISGDENHQRSRLQLRGHLHSVQTRHADVEEGDGRLVLSQGLEALQPIRAFGNDLQLRPLLVQQSHQFLSLRRLIFSDDGGRGFHFRARNAMTIEALTPPPAGDFNAEVGIGTVEGRQLGAHIGDPGSQHQSFAQTDSVIADQHLERGLTTLIAQLGAQRDAPPGAGLGLNARGSRHSPPATAAKVADTASDRERVRGRQQPRAANRGRSAMMSR